MRGPLLLIVGDGPNKWDDLEAFWRLDPGPHEVCCINRAGLLFPCDFRFWCSFHADELAAWGQQRPGPELHSSREHPGVRSWPDAVTDGGSSMVALSIALAHWGFPRVVLAGVPLSGEYAVKFGGKWRDTAHLFAAATRSMSGLTGKLFGRPTAKFVGG